MLPECYCSPDGTQIPGDIEVGQTPQMITLTFNGAVNQDNINIYQDIFKEERLNPNGCQIKGSFFVRNVNKMSLIIHGVPNFKLICFVKIDEKTIFDV